MESEIEWDQSIECRVMEQGRGSEEQVIRSALSIIFEVQMTGSGDNVLAIRRMYFNTLKEHARWKRQIYLIKRTPF